MSYPTEPATGDTQPLIIYMTQHCGDCHRAKGVLDRYGIPYRAIDIGQDEQATITVQRLNRGYRSVPTIVFPDGSHLSEPSPRELMGKLGLTP